MKILLSTGIYPPKVGGPAQYAKNLKDNFEKIGHCVSVKTFGIEGCLQSGLRHLFFFFKIIPKLLISDLVIILDTYSVGFPTVFASKILSKKSIIRTGGDFLWEHYIEKTKKKVLLKKFYTEERGNFSLKERIIFRVTRWTLKNASRVVFSTNWQRDISVQAYNLKSEKTDIIENYYGTKESDIAPVDKVLVGSARNIILKNLDILKKFGVFTDNLPFEKFMQKIKSCFGVIVLSVSEVSPNLILDAIRYNRPFICTREVGIYDRIKNAGTFVDPLDKKQIEEAILNLSTEEGYSIAKEKVKNFNFVHTWEEITCEFIDIFKKI